MADDAAIHICLKRISGLHMRPRLGKYLFVCSE